MTLVLGLFFLLAGTGLNVVHYCCDDCRAAGIEHVSSRNCEAVHCHQQHDECCHHHAGECSHRGCSHHHDGTCWFKHLEVNQGGISPSLSRPEEQVISLLYNSILNPDRLYSVIINSDREQDLCFDTSPNEDDHGRAIILRVCTWLI